MEKQFTVILNRLPEKCPPALLDLLAERFGSSEIPELPALLGESLPELEAAALKTEFELFGAVVEMLGDAEPTLPPGLEELSLELDREIAELKKESGPGLNELAFDLNPTPEPKVETKKVEAPPAKDPFEGLSLSFEDEPAKEEAPPKSESPKAELKPSGLSFAEEDSADLIEEDIPEPTPEAPVEEYSLSLAPEESELSLKVDEETEPVETPTKPAPVAPPVVEAKISEPAPVRERPPVREEPNEEEEEVEVVSPVFVPPKKKKTSKLLYVVPLVLVAAALGFLLLPHEEEETSSKGGTDIVDALLAEQDRLIRDQKVQTLEQSARRKLPGLSLEHYFGQIEMKPVAGVIRLGSAKSGYVFESINLSEPQQEKLSTQDLVAGRKPRPWIKRLEAEAKSPAEPTPNSAEFSGDAFGFIEDEQGTLRVPLQLRVKCEVTPELVATCSVRIRNRGENLESAEPFAVSRDEKRGFLLSMDGLFDTLLKKSPGPK